MWFSPWANGSDRAISIEDLRQLARRRLPRILFDYIEGGAGDESGLRQNLDAFRGYNFRPRYLVDVSTRKLETQLWEWTFAAPFGIGPVGLAGLFRPNAECLLATAAARTGIPYVLSGASIASIEEVARGASTNLWFQLYPARETRISMDIVSRAASAGMKVLVLTVDLPVPAKRERDRRNHFDFDIKLSPSRLMDGLTHPRWALAYLARGGLPTFGTWARYARAGASAREVAEFVALQSFGPLVWRDVDEYRRAWPGKLVLKGIQHAADAARAAASGVDGLIVSNHGGRQLQRLPAAIDLLPEIRAAAGEGVAVMVDGGVRSGCDVAVALSLGADFVFLGRAPIYGVAAGGLAGAVRALEILREELDLTLGQIGVNDVRDLDRDVLMERRC
jgi:L-lactate dehydrogenase (cytochrome)/(S)-mandelate dehydrogenase